MKPKEPSATVYTIPPNKRMHYVLVKMSSRSYCVAEYNGHAILNPDDVFPTIPTEKGGQMWQSGHEFVLCSQPMPLQKAIDLMKLLIYKRLSRANSYDGCIILSDKSC